MSHNHMTPDPMNPNESPMSSATPAPGGPGADAILEQLRPRMRAARISHVRRLAATLAVLPILGFGAVAMAADGSEAPTAETAGGVESDEKVDDKGPDVELPEIGDADGAEAAGNGGDGESDEGADKLAATTTTTTLPADDGIHEVDLGTLGWAEVEETDGGGFTMLSTDFADGWEIHSAEVVDGNLVIIITNGQDIKKITIKPGVRDEISVIVDEVIIPTTTTAKPEPKPEPKPPVIVDRIVVEVPGKGNFVVEREGETLWAGNVTAYEGYTYDIIKAEGWKV